MERSSLRGNPLLNIEARCTREVKLIAILVYQFLDRIPYHGLGKEAARPYLLRKLQGFTGSLVAQAYRWSKGSTSADPLRIRGHQMLINQVRQLDNLETSFRGHRSAKISYMSYDSGIATRFIPHHLVL